MSKIVALAIRQLEAYNASDLGAFCDCYHPEVIVFDAEERIVEGLDDFRERYRGLFEGFQFGAEVSQRLDAGDHCVDYETWWRIDPETGARSEGLVLVRYTLRDEKIGWVQFFRE